MHCLLFLRSSPRLLLEIEQIRFLKKAKISCIQLWFILKRWCIPVGTSCSQLGTKFFAANCQASHRAPFRPSHYTQDSCDTCFYLLILKRNFQTRLYEFSLWKEKRLADSVRNPKNLVQTLKCVRTWDQNQNTFSFLPIFEKVRTGKRMRG